MARFLIPLLAGALTATCVAQAPLPQALKGVHRVVMLGDGITQLGEGTRGYVWLVRHYLQDIYPAQSFQVVNAGVSGNRSNDMATRFEKDVLEAKPDLITISVGMDDVKDGLLDNHPDGDGSQGVPLDAFRKNLEAMVGQGMAAGARVVILSGTPLGEDLDSPMNAKAKSFNNALRDVAREHHLIFVDYQKPFQALIAAYRKTTGASDLLLTVDGIHMNDQGNLVMAHTLLTALGVPPALQEAADKQVFDQEQVQYP